MDTPCDTVSRDNVIVFPGRSATRIGAAGLAASADACANLAYSAATARQLAVSAADLSVQLRQLSERLTELRACYLGL